MNVDPHESLGQLVTEPVARATLWQRTKREIETYFTEKPTLLSAFVPLCFLAIVLYTRHPYTNFIFDEQEALLANPYVRVDAAAGHAMHWYDAFKLDFWGLPPTGTIGSYRPLPNLLWRTLWWIPQVRHSSFFHHFFLNVAGHGLNGALMVLLGYRWTKSTKIAWITGTIFVASAVITEAVCGVVGIADVLSATGALLALLALAAPMSVMPSLVFAATMLGLLSKESALCLVPMIPIAALFMAHRDHPEKPRAFLRAFIALVATAGAFVLYVESRRRNFPTALAPELTAEANAHKGTLGRAFAAVLRWYAQPILPRDPLNNPLIETTPLLRVAGGLRVFFRGLVQVIFPWTLSGDYSAPQEPAPTKFWSLESALGLIALIGLPLAGLVIAFLGIRKEKRGKRVATVDTNLAPHRSHPGTRTVNELDLRPVAGLGLIWIVVSFFPVSNIPVLLPTVRAERFWYFPVLGSALALGMFFGGLFRRATTANTHRIVAYGCGAFIVFQCICARKHANDYRDDLAFWDSARKAVPSSAKAHLNYSVMLGARQNLAGRLESNKRAFELAPNWPMASIYMGDTLCRMHRTAEAMPHYERGFSKAPNDQHLIALALQCLWDEHVFDDDRAEREALREKSLAYPGSWYAYLVEDILLNGKENKGVDPKYRPRSYNEGPKK